MSRATVRTAVKDFLTGTVTNLGFVYSNFPTSLLSSPTFGLPASGSSQGWAVVFIESDSERRVALGGATSGKKRVEHQIRVDIHYRSTAVAETAQDDFDTLIDSLKTKLRSDRTLGSSAIFEAAEDIDSDYNEPVLDTKLKHVICTAQVRFTASEFLTT